MVENLRFNKVEIAIFDMDGTLYQHDGENGTIKNSSLFNCVISNSVKFVAAREDSSTEEAIKLVMHAHSTDKIGISNFLANRYGITRSQYFDEVWDIDPSGIVKDYEKRCEYVKAISRSGLRMFLLTAAPRIWMINVLNFLDLNTAFERKYNGEMFDTKEDVFISLAKEFNPNSLLSVGDQDYSDIVPAANLGMQGFLVKDSSDFSKLINII